LAARRQLLAPQPTFLACGSKEEDVYFRCCGGEAATTTEKDRSYCVISNIERYSAFLLFFGGYAAKKQKKQLRRATWTHQSR
jgi:hypothetical protein